MLVRKRERKETTVWYLSATNQVVPVSHAFICKIGTVIARKEKRLEAAKKIRSDKNAVVRKKLENIKEDPES